MNAKTKSKSVWKKIKGCVVGLTGVLVVVPALINSGIDIYNTWKKIPRTEAERTNVELFKKYFGKSPKVTLPPTAIKHGQATYEVKLSIYDEGDIFVEYGKQTQWLPFPKPAPTTAATFSLMGTAHAQDLSVLYGPYRQKDSFKGYFLIRNRWYKSGATEQQVIDTRTGEIVSIDVTPPPSHRGSSQSIAPFAGIDLNAPQYDNQGVEQLAHNCISQAGVCQLFYPTLRGAQCYCMTAFGPAFGQAD